MNIANLLLKCLEASKQPIKKASVTNNAAALYWRKEMAFFDDDASKFKDMNVASATTGKLHARLVTFGRE